MLAPFPLFRYNRPHMADRIVLAFVGMPGSGKGTCTTYLADKYHFPVIHFGNMLYEEIARRGLDNVADEQFVRVDMRKMEGPAVLAKHAARKADTLFESGEEVIVFDGLYSWTEFKYLHEQYGDGLILIATAADKAERYRRIMARKDSHRKYTSTQQIIDREIAEIENIEKGGPIAYADYTIVNNSDKEFLLQDLDMLLSNLNLVSSKHSA
jgi:dephospho-CoA kinase